MLECPDFLRVTKLTGQDSSTQNYIGFITSSLLLGAFVGCIPASLIADMFSRRVAITVGAVTFLLGGALQTGARNKEFMMAGRFFAGMSIGQLALLVPLYQSEIAHPSIRGRLTTLQQFFLGIGALTAAWINYGMIHNHLGTPLQWRFPLGFQMAPAAPLLFITLILPESPRWLMLKGREEEALNILARLHARGDKDDPFVLGEFHEMQAKIREEAEIDQGWGQIFRKPQNFRRVMLGVILQFSVQMTGVSFLQYYAPRIFAKVGFSTETTLLLGAAGGFPNMASQFAVVMLVDKLGRRGPLIVCNAISGFLYIFILWITYKFTVDDSGTQTMGRAFVALTWVWNIFFSWIGSLSWAYPVEIMNSAIRAKAVAVTSMACWIANFMIVSAKLEDATDSPRARSARSPLQSAGGGTTSCLSSAASRTRSRCGPCSPRPRVAHSRRWTTTLPVRAGSCRLRRRQRSMRERESASWRRRRTNCRQRKRARRPRLSTWRRSCRLNIMNMNI